MRIWDMLLSAQTKLEQADNDVNALGEKALELFTLVKRAVESHTQHCEEYPKSPMAKMFKKNKSRMKIYPIDEIDETPLKGLTYGDCKKYIDGLNTKKEEASTKKRKINAGIRVLKEYYERIQSLDDVYSTKDVVNCSINMQDLHDEVKTDWKQIEKAIADNPSIIQELHKQRFSICMVMETVEMYPLEYPSNPKRAGTRRISQQMYFYFPERESDNHTGYWYLDSTGMCNYEEFIIIDNTRPYQMIHNSEHEYLNTMFNWYGMHVSEVKNSNTA